MLGDNGCVNINKGVKVVVKRMHFYRELLRVLLGIWLCLGMAQAQQLNQSTGSLNQLGDDSPLSLIPEGFNNSTTLLDNRFRIDKEVEQVTLLLFRNYGSGPVVIIRPDGSKIFFRDAANDANLEWYDAANYDLIRINNPMPGPYQAVGQLSPDSRVMVLSDIELVADDLPPIIFSGEVFKHTASLTMDGKPINYPEFRDLVDLEIDFTSTNNPNFANFGSGTVNVAVFADDGQGFDERPKDGVFTGQFVLTIPPGQWIPVFRVETPLYVREKRGQTVTLQPNPIQVTTDIKEGEEENHQLFIDVAREYVDMATMVFDGRIHYPNGDIISFSKTELTDKVKQLEVTNVAYGDYRIEIRAYGETLAGRDFIVTVPPVSFVTKAPPPPVEETQQPLQEMVNELVPNGEEPQQPTESAESPMALTTAIIIAVVVNVLLLTAGLAIILLVKDHRNRQHRSVYSRVSRAMTSANKQAIIQLKALPESVLDLLKKQPKNNDDESTDADAKQHESKG